MCKQACVCVCVCVCVRERDRPAATQIKVIIPKICSSADSSSLAVPHNATVIVRVRSDVALCARQKASSKKLTFSPQDMTWKLSRPESLTSAPVGRG